MLKFILKRVSKSQYGTFGVMLRKRGDQFVPFVTTLEDPWRNNAPFISCIPEGTYVCKRVRSPKFGDTFEVTKVPGRDLIRFHWGTTIEDTEGCILVGEEFGADELDLPVLWASKRGFAEFLRRLEGCDEFELEIVEA